MSVGREAVREAEALSVSASKAVGEKGNENYTHFYWMGPDE